MNNKIDNELEKTIHNNKLIDNGKGVFLTNYDKEVLEKYQFDYKKYANINELLFDIEDYLDISYEEDLDYVLEKLSEMHYYNDINK